MKIFKLVLSIVLFLVSGFVSFACWRVSYTPLPLAVTSSYLTPQVMYRIYFLIGWASGWLAMACFIFVLSWMMDFAKYIKAHNKQKEVKVA